jgi:hypothetical protein
MTRKSGETKMKNRLFALAAAALLSGTAAVWAQGAPQDQKDQMARPDAQPGAGEDQKGSAPGGEQDMQTPNREDRNLQPAQMQGEQRGPQGGQMLRGGEMRGGTPHTLTVQQKTNLRETVLKTGPRLTHVSFRIGVGVSVPRSLHLVAVPQPIVAIYPEWASDLYFAYSDEIVIVEPNSFAIVAVLPL